MLIGQSSNSTASGYLYNQKTCMPRIFQKTTPKRGLVFDGISLAHNLLEKEGVQQILNRAAAVGGTVLKPAQDAF